MRQNKNKTKYKNTKTKKKEINKRKQRTQSTNRVHEYKGRYEGESDDDSTRQQRPLVDQYRQIQRETAVWASEQDKPRAKSSCSPFPNC